MSKPCECPLAGWCERHKMQKVGHLHERCQNDERFREAWDKQVEQRMPSLLTQAANLGRAVINHVKDGLAQADEETRRIRLETCQACDKLDKSSQRCQECGCFVTVKAGWKSETCPVGKWEAAEAARKPAAGWVSVEGGCGCRK